MRRTLIIILVIIVLGGTGWYFYAKSKQSQGGVPSLSDFGSFFPIGNNLNSETPGTIPDGSEEPAVTTPVYSPYKQLSPNAVTDFTTYTRTENVIIPADPLIPRSKPTTKVVTHNILRYVARNSGYVYEIEDGGVPVQVSNIYIPNIYEALFNDKGNTAILRFLRGDQRTIATYSLPVPPPNPDGTRTQKAGIYLSDGISNMVASPDGTQIAKITSDANGGLLSIASSLDLKKIDIIRTPFREWLVSWPNQKNIYLQTKASAKVPGYLYRVDTTEKKLRRVLGNINGLTTSISPSGSYILYSQNSGNVFITKLLNTKTNKVTNFSLVIMPEKCTWLSNEDLICAGNSSVPEANYPDAWYMGTTSFSDQLYRIYPNSSLYDNLDNTKTFDMTKLRVDEVRKELYFIDKTTGVLWQFSY